MNENQRQLDMLEVARLLQENAALDARVEGVIADGHAHAAAFNVAARQKMNDVMNICDAIEVQDIEVFDRLLSAIRDEDINYHWRMSRNPDPATAQEYTLLKVARESGWVHAIDVLLERGADPIDQDIEVGGNAPNLELGEQNQNPDPESRLAHLQNVFARALAIADAYVPVNKIVIRSQLAVYAHCIPAADILPDAIKAHNIEAFDIAFAKVSDVDLNHQKVCKGHSILGDRVTHTFLQISHIYNFPHAVNALLSRGADDHDAMLYQGQEHVCDQVHAAGVVMPLPEGGGADA